MARESLSARLDGEAGEVPAARLDEHLAQCPACRRWSAEAAELARRTRLAPAPPVPDLTDHILASAPEPDPRRRWPRTGVRVTVARPAAQCTVLLGTVLLLWFTVGLWSDRTGTPRTRLRAAAFLVSGAVRPDRAVHNSAA